MLAEGVATTHAMPGRRIGFASAAMGCRKRIVRAPPPPAPLRIRVKSVRTIPSLSQAPPQAH
jgi:hypothetical protein